MKLVTSTGDFAHYVPTIADAIREIGKTKFKYINLEQTGRLPSTFYEDGDEWRRECERWIEAFAETGLVPVVAHAPCVNVFERLGDEETYQNKLRAVRRSIENCHTLGISRIVVHACPNAYFTPTEFYRENRRFYRDLFDLMEKYDISVLTENWTDDPSCPLSTGRDLRDFAEFIDHPLLGVCWDTAHANLNKRAKAVGQYRCICDVGDKLKGLHVSDNFGDGAHHHTWPFAGNIRFDEVLQGVLDVNYDGYFTFEASYTLLHQFNPPYGRPVWKRDGEEQTKLLNPPIWLKRQAVDLLYDIGKYMLESYGCFEE